MHPAINAAGNTVAAKQISGKEKMAKITKKDVYKLLKLNYSSTVKFHDVRQEETMWCGFSWNIADIRI